MWLIIGPRGLIFPLPAWGFGMSQILMFFKGETATSRSGALQGPIGPSVGLDLLGFDWVCSGWIGSDWVGLGWIGSDWVGLGWIGLDWVGWSDWAALAWIGLHRVRLGRMGSDWVDWIGWGWFGLGRIITGKMQPARSRSPDDAFGKVLLKVQVFWARGVRTPDFSRQTEPCEGWDFELFCPFFFHLFLTFESTFRR